MLEKISSVLTHQKLTLFGTSRQSIIEIREANWKEGFPLIFLTLMAFKGVSLFSVLRCSGSVLLPKF